MTAAALRAGSLSAIVLTSLAAPHPAVADPEKAPVIVTMRGLSTGVNKPLAREIRRRMVDAMGPLHSSRAWWRALGLEDDDAEPAVEDLAKAARAVGAEYLVDLTMTRFKGQWVLNVRLIRTADASILRRPRYPFKSMGPVAQRWHAKQVVELTEETIAREAQRGG